MRPPYDSCPGIKARSLEPKVLPPRLQKLFSKVNKFFKTFILVLSNFSTLYHSTSTIDNIDAGRLTCACCQKRQMACLPSTASKGAGTKCEGCRLAKVACVPIDASDVSSKHKSSFSSFSFNSIQGATRLTALNKKKQKN